MILNKRFKIKQKLGEGRSTVFLCEDFRFPGRRFAIKVLPNITDKEEIKLFEDEFFILKNLSHPNIIQVFDRGTILIIDDPDKKFNISPGSKFFTLEYFEGKTLSEISQIKDELFLRNLIKQISSVLYYLHQSNYIYYDLKPENILIKSFKNELKIKFIDFGLTGFIPESDDNYARGTAEYIAPEIIGKQYVDHRADLYSLGILLYKLVYDKFPFSTHKEIEIYKAHLEQEFEFPQTKFQGKIIDAIKKLLAKDPVERFKTSLELLAFLNIEIDEELKKEFIPAKIFSNRHDAIAYTGNYIERDSLGKIFFIRGSEGSGKSFLFEKILREYSNAVLITSDDIISERIWRHLLREITFCESVFSQLNDDIKPELLELIENESDASISTLKNIINTISKEAKFILLIDDFNRFDDFSMDFIKEILPFLRVNDIKIIISEDSAFPYISDTLKNITSFNLTPFTENDVRKLLEVNFAGFFPREELRKIILLYADLLPGNIELSIRDLIFLNVLNFTAEGPVINKNSDTDKLLAGSHDEIFRLRIKDLSKDELKTAEQLSLFEAGIEEDKISVICNISLEQVENILNKLREKNILLPTNVNPQPKFTSESLKKYIYSKINDKDEFHKATAEIISAKIPGFNRPELARQYELAGSYDKSLEVYNEEIKTADSIYALSYKKNLLQHVNEFPVDDNEKFRIKLELIKTLQRLGERKTAFDLCEELLGTDLNVDDNREVLIQKGIALNGMGETKQGKEILESVLPEINDARRKNNLKLEIADSEFDLNNYQTAVAIAGEIIKSRDTSDEDKAKAFNLLALVEIYAKGNLDGSIDQFENALNIYKKIEQPVRVAAVEMNIGNIYNMKGEYTQASSRWDKSLEINQSVGSLEQEAHLLLNYGVFNFERLNFELAIEQYKRALVIFRSTGDSAGTGLVLNNLGEVYCFICEYQEAFNSYSEAGEIFRSMSNFEEYAEVMFMLGKYYYVIGGPEDLKGVIKEYHSIIQKEKLTEKHSFNLEFLEQLNTVQKAYRNDLENPLKRIREKYRETSDTANYILAHFTIIELFIEMGNLQAAIEELNDNNFVEICSKNLYYMAKKKRYLARISDIADYLKLEPAVKYLEDAYNEIKDEHISESTWQILYMLAEIYYNRGNLNKAKEFIVYAKSLILFTADKFLNPDLKQKYLKKPDRQKALDRLELMEQNC